MKTRLSLKPILTALIIFTVLVPAVIAMIGFSYYAYNVQLTRFISEDSRVSALYKSQIRNELNRYYNLAVHTIESGDALAIYSDNNKVTAIINNLNIISAREGSIRSVVVHTTEREIIAVDAHTDSALAGHLLSRLADDRVTVKWHISAPVKINNEFIFRLSMSVGDSQNVMLSMFISIDGFMRGIEKIQTFLNSSVRKMSILDSSGVLLATISGSRYTPGINLGHIELIDNFLSKNILTAELEYEGISGSSVYGYVENIEQVNWLIVSEFQSSDIINVIRGSIIYAVLITLAVLAVILLIVLFLMQKSLGPIVDLQKSISAAATSQELLNLKPSVIREIDLISSNIKKLLSIDINASIDLHSREQYLAMTLDSMGDAVIATDSAGYILRMNPVAEKITGWKLAEALGKSVQDIFSLMNTLTRKPIENPIVNVLSNGEAIFLNNNITLISRQGREYKISDSAAPIVNKAGDVLGMVLVFNEITEQGILLEKTQKSGLEMKNLLDNMLTMVGILNIDGAVTYVNNSPLKMVGVVLEDVVGVKLWDGPWFNYNDGVKAGVKNAIVAAAAGETVLIDLQIFTLQGLLWIEFGVHPVFDTNGMPVKLVAEGRDISLRKKAEDKVHYQAHFDALTGLSNRFLMLERLDQLVSNARRNHECVAVLFLDLDDFKKINDSLGHEAGDKLLIQAAERLNSVVRCVDTVGRLGGDEFIVLLGGLNKAHDASPIANKLIKRFRQAFSIDGRKLMLTTSLGIAVFPEDGNNSSELLRNADSAMYHSKSIGRNTYSYFTHEMNRDVSRRLLLEEQLHGALERGEFSVVYQPKIEISSGKITGAEALLRWHNRLLGDVLPEEFIPITEQNGLIIAIGEFVITQALEVNAKWHKLYDATFNMSVNLSPRQFRDPNLISFIDQAIKLSGIKTEYLELEITEGVLMNAHSYVNDVLTELASLGVKISMDDFGTGYSSLSNLRNYPFNVLKIDRSFINNISEDYKNRELISASIAMAHSLNLVVVAEGVETDEQYEYLKCLGCDYAQGFLLGMPMPAEVMGEVLESLSNAA